MSSIEEARTAALGLLSPDGWAYASSPPVQADDPGRFHALFGRDSLIFALQVLPELPHVARSTLESLAEVQGRVDDPEIEERPGRIIHEYRPVAPEWLLERGWPAREGSIKYYGSSDSTSWFLILLDAVADARLTHSLDPNWRAAAQWLEVALAEGNGLIRCGPRRYPGGLAQQGWRDSLDPSSDQNGGGIIREDGTMPSPPLADADSQAAAVAALDALARIDSGRKDHWTQAASELRKMIVQHFAPNVMAIDGLDSPVSGSGSQLGWLLWANAIDDSSIDAYADQLCADSVMTDYGVRTLASSHPQFLANGYHRGAVWPFDSWLSWGGLRRAGREEEAEVVRGGVLRALKTLGRFPELYSITAAGSLERIPVANMVQAWTVGAALAFGLEWDGQPRASSA